MGEFTKAYLITVLVIIIFIAVLFILTPASSTEMTASVGLNEGNCYTTYLANKDKFDKCLE